MRRYETLVVLNPELPEAQTRETVDRARRLLTESGAEDFQVQEWGMRDLSYEIRRQKRGYYVLLEYNATPPLVKELERNLKIADEVLRFISVAATKGARKRSPDEAGVDGAAVAADPAAVAADPPAEVAAPLAVE
jgi:small subunit ribosomal protein S6